MMTLHRHEPAPRTVRSYAARRGWRACGRGNYLTIAPPVTGQATFEQAQQIVQIVTLLEMMYGEDIMVTYSGKLFSTVDFEKMFINIVASQNPASSIPGPNSVPSGDAGWWGGADHHIVNSTDFYLCLRRNPTAVGVLVSVHGRMPCGLEHILLPSSSSANLTTQLPGGGLVGLMPWLQEMAWSCAIPGGPCPPNINVLPPQQPHPTNFWGELIGVTALYAAMRDQVPLIQNHGWISDPLLSTPMGARIVDLWLLWRERFAAVNPMPFLSTPSIMFPSPPGYAEWEGPPTYGSVLDAFGNVNPLVGQDWDVSLHQLARAVQAMHHMGYSFTQADQELVVLRLTQWATATCEFYDTSLSCSPNPLSRADPTYAVPSERYGWTAFEGGDACANAGPGSAIPSPAISAMVAAANALAWSRALDQPATPAVRDSALLLGRSIAIAVGTLYRTRASGSAGWANVSGGPQALSVQARGLFPDWRGTTTAVSTLFLLARTPALAGILGTHPSARLSLRGGLHGFLHVFGGSIVTTIAMHPWSSSYVPG